MDIQGEKIKCLSNFQTPELVVGKIYTAGITRKNVHGVWQVEVGGKWYIHDRFELVSKEQPQGVPPSHVALGSELVQVGEPYMKIWCDTCQGTGEIDETVGGLPPQYARENAPCPDCDGNGWWERVIAASVDNAPVQQAKKHSHYFKKCGYDYVDVYRTIKMFDVTDPCLQHAVKKLLVTGGRGFKDIETDVQDVIDTLERWKEMFNEDRARGD